MSRPSFKPPVTLLKLILLILAVIGPACAEELQSGDLTIAKPWARATPPTAVAGAAYLSLANSGDTADKLLAVSGDVSEKVELHTHIMEDNVMMMREVDAIEIPARGQVQLKPGGLHIMLISLKDPLEPGKTFPLTLTFEKAGAATVNVTVYKEEPSE
jgi:copper(I)-binding protein